MGPLRRRHRLEPMRGVVGEIADRAAGESRQVRHVRRAEVGHQLADRRHEAFARLLDLAGPLDRGLAVARADDEKWVLAEERVAADVLPALDAFEQERVVGVLGNLQERRDRRQQVGDDLLAHRHERAARGQFLELVERRELHDCDRDGAIGRANERRRDSAAARMTPGFGTTAGPRLELHRRLGHQHLQASDRLAAGGTGVAQEPRLLRVVDQVVHEPSIEVAPRARASRRPAAPCRRAWR